MLKPDEILELIERSKRSKFPHEMVHTVARLVQAGDEQVSLDQFDEETRSFWNFFRTASFIQLGKITGQDPHVQVKPQQDLPTTEALQNAAIWFQRKMNSQDRKGGFEDILASAENDNLITGTGFIYVRDDGSMEHLSCFDVYVDNIMAKPYAIHNGRYVFIRRPMDENELAALLKDEELYVVEDGEYVNMKVTNEGIEHDKKNNLTTISDLPGREIAGTAIDKRWDLSEFETSSYRDTTDYSVFDSKATTVNDADGICEVWECWFTDDESPSGWVKALFYDDKIIGEPLHLPVGFDGPPLFSFAYNRISGQFWQDGMFVEIEKTQLAVNDLTNRILYLIAMMEYPPLLTHVLDEDNEYTFTPGERVTYHDGANKPEYMKLPQPPALYMQIRNNLQQDCRDNMGVHEVDEGRKPKGIQAGIALEKLSQESNTRIAPLLLNRDSTLRQISRRRVQNILYNEQQTAKQKAEKYNVEELPKIEKNREALNPEEVATNPAPGRNIYDYLPKPIQNITFEEVSEGYAFTFRITPRIERSEKIDKFLMALEKTIPLAEGLIPDPVMSRELGIDLAAMLTDHRDIGEEMKTTIEQSLMEYLIEVQNMEVEEKESADQAAINAPVPSEAVQVPDDPKAQAEAVKKGGSPVASETQRKNQSVKSYGRRKNRQLETRSKKQ